MEHAVYKFVMGCDTALPGSYLPNFCRDIFPPFLKQDCLHMASISPFEIWIKS